MTYLFFLFLNPTTEINADIRGRVRTRNWYNGSEQEQETSTDVVESPPPPPLERSIEGGKNDIVLSMLNERYRDIMWSHFRKLGKVRKGGSGEDELGVAIFHELTKDVGSSTRRKFYKKSPYSDDLIQVDEDAALQSECYLAQRLRCVNSPVSQQSIPFI